MANATGANSEIHVAFETTYGEKPTGSVTWYKIPFVSTSLGLETAPIDSNVIGQGREPTRPTNGPKTVSGDIVVPTDFRNLPLWWKMAFGAPTTTGNNAPYVHAFASGSTSIPSMSIQIAHSDVGVYRLLTGCRLNTFSGSVDYGTLTDLTMNFICKDEARFTATQIGANVETLAGADGDKRFGSQMGSFQHKGATLPIISASFDYSNNLTPFEIPFNGNTILDADLGRATLTGTMSVALSDDTKYLLEDDENNVYGPVTFNFDSPDNTMNRLVITMEDCRVDVPSIPITSDERIDIDVTYTATGSGANGDMIAISHTNDTADYA